MGDKEREGVMFMNVSNTRQVTIYVVVMNDDVVDDD